MAVFLLDPLRLEPQHLHEPQCVMDERFFFQSAVWSLVRVVLLHEVVEQEMAVGKFDPRSLVEPYIRIARRTCLLWTRVKWEPWMVEQDLIWVIKGMSVVVL